MKLSSLCAAAALCLSALPALADVVTFDGRAEDEVLPGTVQIEGNFSWRVVSGGAFQGLGNSRPGLEALSRLGGGVVSFVRNDVVDGLFTFEGSDIARFLGPDPADIVFEGYLGNTLVSSDTLTTNGGFINWRNAVSSSLAGLGINELRVRLDRGEMIDNVRFGAATAVPEPGTICLLGLALTGLAVMRRRAA